MTPRDHQIIAAVRDGRRLHEVAAQFGMSVAGVRKVLGKHGAGAPRRAGPRPKVEEAAPLSPLSHRVAQRFYRWRAVDNDLLPSEAASIIGMTLPRVGQLERGTLAFTLPELERLAAALHVTPSELLA